MREFSRSFYKSAAWKKCRLSYVDRVHGLCERCGSGGKIVHHKVYLNEKNINDTWVTLNHENLELLCQDCHNREHMARSSMNKSLFFDANGDLKKI